MSLNLSAIAVRERAVTLFLILMLVAAGAYAFVMLGRAEDPGGGARTVAHRPADFFARQSIADPCALRVDVLWYGRRT